MTNTTKPALSAAPVAQEPVAYQYRACIAGKWGDWTDLHQSVEGFRNGPWKFRLENGTCELRALYAGTPPAASVEVEELKDFIQSASFSSRSADDGDTIFCQIYTPGYPPQHKGSFGFYVKDLRAILLLLTRGPDQGEVVQTSIATKQPTDPEIRSATETALTLDFVRLGVKAGLLMDRHGVTDQMRVDLGNLSRTLYALLTEADGVANRRNRLIRIRSVLTDAMPMTDEDLEAQP